MSELNDFGYEFHSPQIGVSDTLKGLKLKNRKDVIVEKIGSLNDVSDIIYQSNLFDAVVITFSKPKNFDLIFNGYVLNSNCEIFAYKMPEDFSYISEVKPNLHNFYRKSDLIDALNKFIREYHETNESIARFERIKQHSLTGTLEKFANKFRKGERERINRKILNSIKKGFKEYLRNKNSYGNVVDGKIVEQINYISDLIKKLEELDNEYGTPEFDEEEYRDLNYLWYKVFQLLSRIIVKIE